MANQAAAITTAAGIDMPELRAEYKAHSGALSKIVGMYVPTAASAGAANDNLQLALDQANRVPRTGAPIANRFTQWLQLGDKALVGNPELSQLELYIYAASREYAKVVSGSAMSMAQLTDTAAKKSAELLSSAQTPETFAKVVTGMQNDMNNYTQNQLKQIHSESNVIGRFLSASTGVPIPQGGTAGTPATAVPGSPAATPTKRYRYNPATGETVEIR
jgi:hypothetical protein